MLLVIDERFIITRWHIKSININPTFQPIIQVVMCLGNDVQEQEYFLHVLCTYVYLFYVWGMVPSLFMYKMCLDRYAAYKIPNSRDNHIWLIRKKKKDKKKIYNTWESLEFYFHLKVALLVSAPRGTVQRCWGGAFSLTWLELAAYLMRGWRWTICSGEGLLLKICIHYVS